MRGAGGGGVRGREGSGGNEVEGEAAAEVAVAAVAMEEVGLCGHRRLRSEN